VIRFVVEMLAAIPSVVVRTLGISVVIPIIKIFGDWAVKNLGGIPISGPAYGELDADRERGPRIDRSFPP